MSYELRALIGALPTMMSWPLIPPYRLVRLGHGMAMIPLVHAIDDANEVAGSAGDLLMRLSDAGPVADVHARAYGSARAQIVGVWHHRRPLLNLDKPEAINKALRLLGVTAALGLDKFDTVGSGRERDTEDW